MSPHGWERKLSFWWFGCCASVHTWWSVSLLALTLKICYEPNLASGMFEPQISGRCTDIAPFQSVRRIFCFYHLTMMTTYLYLIFYPTLLCAFVPKIHLGIPYLITWSYILFFWLTDWLIYAKTLVSWQTLLSVYWMSDILGNVNKRKTHCRLKGALMSRMHLCLKSSLCWVFSLVPVWYIVCQYRGYACGVMVGVNHCGDAQWVAERPHGSITVQSVCCPTHKKHISNGKEQLCNWLH